MRLEHIPLIFGVIVALIGLGFIADASMAATTPPSPERRRRTRAEPSRAGEAVVGIGTLCMAAALLGRDTWRYGTLVVLVGGALLLIGIILNRAFLKEALLFRGPARRAEGGSGTGAGKGSRPPGPPRKAAQTRPPAATNAAPTRPAAPTTAAPNRPAAPAAATSGRHPTTPLGTPAYRPPANAAAAPPPTPAHAPTKPSTPPPPKPNPPPTQPPGPKERRKTPRGKG